MSDQIAKKTEKQKKLKRAFPIRVGVVLPLALTIAGIWFYFATLFDAHMRWALQKGLTMVNGAEVNVRGVDTDFSEARLQISGLQMTNNQLPEQNWLQIDKMVFALSWDGLLRAKFVVNDASILGIGTNIPRRKPGFIVPEEPEKPEESGKENAVLTAAESYFKDAAAGTFFEDLANLQKGFNPKQKLDEIKADLASEQKLKEIEKMYQDYKKNWEAQYAKIQNDPDYKKYEATINSFKSKQVKTPDDVKKAVKEVQDFKKSVENKIAEVKGVTGQAQTGVQNLEKETRTIPQLVEADIRNLQGQLKLPDIKLEDLSGVVFGEDVMKKVHQGLFYYQKGKHLMGAVKSAGAKDAAEKKALTSRERRKGRNYQFPIKNRTLPAFYVKHSELSVFEEGQTETEAIHGTLTDLSSSPSLLPNPVRLVFSGNLTAKGIKGISGEAVFDHRYDDFKESFSLGIEHIPVSEHALTQSKEAKIWLQKAALKLATKGEVTAGGMGFENNIALREAEYRAEAASKDLQRILSGVLGGISATQLHVSLKGDWTNLKMSVNSDLGRLLQKALKSQFDQELARARKEVEAYVQSKLKGGQETLNQEIAKVRGQIAEVEKKYTDQLKNYEAMANQQAEEFKKKLQGKANEELSKQLKKFKFP